MKGWRIASSDKTGIGPQAKPGLSMKNKLVWLAGEHVGRRWIAGRPASFLFFSNPASNPIIELPTYHPTRVCSLSSNISSSSSRFSDLLIATHWHIIPSGLQRFRFQPLSCRCVSNLTSIAIVSRSSRRHCVSLSASQPLARISCRCRVSLSASHAITISASLVFSCLGHGPLLSVALPLSPCSRPIAAHMSFSQTEISSRLSASTIPAPCHQLINDLFSVFSPSLVPTNLKKKTGPSSSRSKCGRAWTSKSKPVPNPFFLCPLQFGLVCFDSTKNSGDVI